MITQTFVPALTGGCQCNPDERRFLSLPVCHIGLNIINSVISASREYNASENISEPLKEKFDCSEERIIYNQSRQTCVSKNNRKRKVRFKKLESISTKPKNDGSTWREGIIVVVIGIAITRSRFQLKQRTIS